MTTSVVVTESIELTRTKAPALPFAPVEYARQYQDTLNNILRQYFNTLDNFVGQLTLSDGGTGAGVYLPNGAFHQDGYTTLSTTIPNPTDTSDIVVASTTGFLSSGALLIGEEIIKYTGKTSTTFTGITRNAYASSASSHTAGVYVSEVQAVPSATTSLALAMTTTDVSSGVYIDPTYNTRIVFDYPGRYNIQFSMQLMNFSTAEDNMTVWFRKDNADIAYSAGVATVQNKHGSKPGTVISSWNVFIDITAAGEYVEMIMSSETGNGVVVTFPPGTSPTRPSSPSVILTASFVSAI